MKEVQMAEDEEVEAVARAWWSHESPATGVPWQMVRERTKNTYRARAGEAIAALDRVRSRPASGTEGEDHEAGIVRALRRAVSALGAAAVAFRKLDEGTGYPPHVAAENTKRAEDEARGALRQHDAARARELRIFNKGYLAAPSPASGTEPDNSGQRGMRDYLAMKQRPSMEVSGTEPDTANDFLRIRAALLEWDADQAEKFILDLTARRLGYSIDASLEPDTAKLVEAVKGVIVRNENARRGAQRYFPEPPSPSLEDTAREVIALLAGFSVDAGKPESRSERDITDVFRSDEAMRAFGVERPDEAGPDGQ